MAEDTGDWEVKSEDDLSLAEDKEVEYHPLAILACELAICFLYVEEGHGGWCDDCTCALKFHCAVNSGDCELCNCIVQHIKPPPMMIPSARLPVRRQKECSDFEVVMDKDRCMAARMVLKELSD